MTPIPDWMLAAGAELLADTGDELRAEAAADEAAAAAFHLRTRTLSGAAAELMHGGDLVMVYLEAGTVAGTVVRAGADIATLQTGGSSILHVNLRAGVALGVTRGRRPSRGRARDPSAPETLRALLRHLELQGRPVRIVVNGPLTEVAGRIGAVAVDHLLVRDDDTEWLLPMNSVAGVWEQGSGD